MGDEFKDVDVKKPIMVVTGGKAVDEHGNRYWWPDEDAEATAASPLPEDWTEVGYMTDDAGVFSKPAATTISVEATGVNTKLLGTIFGFDGSEEEYRPRHSVIIENTDIVSGRPPYPKLPWDESLRWWEFRKRGKINTERERLIRRWELDCRDWEAAGRPDREILVRRFIPNAQITEA